MAKISECRDCGERDFSEYFCYDGRCRACNRKTIEARWRKAKRVEAIEKENQRLTKIITNIHNKVSAEGAIR